MMPNTPSPRPARLIAGASRHPSRNRTRPASVIALSLSIAPTVFQARPAGRRLSVINIIVSFPVSFYLVSQDV